MLAAGRSIALNIGLAFIATALGALAYVWGPQTSLSDSLYLAFTFPLFMAPKAPLLLGLLSAGARALLARLFSPVTALVISSLLAAPIGAFEGFWLTFRSVHLAMPPAILWCAVSWFGVFTLFGGAAHLWHSRQARTGAGAKEGPGAA
jgi:hypothetical protein